MTTETYTIRLAAPEDIKATLEMKLRAWRETYQEQRPEAFFAAAESRLEMEADWWARGLAQGAELWIATDEQSNVIGVAGGGPASEDDADAGVDIELQVLYVLADHHGTGIGERLLEAVLDGRDAVLWVLEANPRAQAFYVNHGFVADGRIEALADQWAGLNEIRMVRRSGNRG